MRLAIEVELVILWFLFLRFMINFLNVTNSCHVKYDKMF